MPLTSFWAYLNGTADAQHPRMPVKLCYRRTGLNDKERHKRECSPENNTSTHGWRRMVGAAGSLEAGAFQRLTTERSIQQPNEARQPNPNEVVPLSLLVDCCSARNSLVNNHAMLLILHIAQTRSMISEHLPWILEMLVLQMLATTWDHTLSCCAV